MGLAEAGVGRPHDPLLHGADLADLRDHLPRRTRALWGLCGRRSGTVPAPTDRAGPRPRPAGDGLTERLGALCKILRSWEDASARDFARPSPTGLSARIGR